jgi:hypothetical protein
MPKNSGNGDWFLSLLLLHFILCLVFDGVIFFSFYLSLDTMCLEQQGCFEV